MNLIKFGNLYFDANKISWLEVAELNIKCSIKIGFVGGDIKAFTDLDASVLTLLLDAFSEHENIKIISIPEI